MAYLNILSYPDARLRTIAIAVAEQEFNDTLANLIHDMAQTMYAASGIGLAATQVNVHKRIIVIDISPDQNQLQVFINPHITTLIGKCKNKEGCLSIPNIYEEVERAAEVIVTAQDLMGKHFEVHADGMLAICIQHEIAHLNGQVFIDQLSPLKRNRIIEKIKKFQRKK